MFIGGILLAQALFVAYGLFLVFWVLNEWFAERGLNAIFGAGLGGGVFFAAWFQGRDWARAFWRRNYGGNLTPLTPPGDRGRG